MKQKEKGIPCKLNLDKVGMEIKASEKNCISQNTDVVVWMRNAPRGSSIGTWTSVGATVWGGECSLAWRSMSLLHFLITISTLFTDPVVISVCFSDYLLLYLPTIIDSPSRCASQKYCFFYKLPWSWYFSLYNYKWFFLLFTSHPIYDNLLQKSR